MLDIPTKIQELVAKGYCIEEMGLFRDYKCTCDKCINELMHTNFDNEIHTEPNVDRTNNIIIGIAIGVTIMICGVIYLVGMVMSS